MKEIKYEKGDKVVVVQEWKDGKFSSMNGLPYEYRTLIREGCELYEEGYRHSVAGRVVWDIFPVKWCIKVDGKNQKEVGGWFNENGTLGINDYDSNPQYLGYYHFPATPAGWHLKISGVGNDYKEIDIDQFRKYILKQTSEVDRYKIPGTEMPNMGVINYRCMHWGTGVENGQTVFGTGYISGGTEIFNGVEYICFDRPQDFARSTRLDFMIKTSDLEQILKQQTMGKTATLNGKEVVGYKSPMDLFGGNIKAGTIFKKLTENTYKTDDTGATQYSRHLPKEIVESWEIVYKEEIKPGDWVVVDKPDSEYWKTAFILNKISSSGQYAYNKNNHNCYFKDIRLATEEEIATAKKSKRVKIAEFESEKVGENIKFGCQSFTRDQLLAYKKLLNGNINATIEIKRTKITLKMLDKLINQLDG